MDEPDQTHYLDQQSATQDVIDIMWTTAELWLITATQCEQNSQFYFIAVCYLQLITLRQQFCMTDAFTTCPSNDGSKSVKVTPHEQ